MPTIPARLHEAFEKIRLGRADEGIRLFDRIDGCEPVKSIALAEVSYFRHDWKLGMAFARDFFESDRDWETVRYSISDYKRIHLTLILIATFRLGCWKETRLLLEEWRKNEPHYDKRYNNHNDILKAIALVSDPENTARSLTGTSPKLRTEGRESFDSLESQLSFLRKDKKVPWRHRLYRKCIDNARFNASSEDHARFYRKHAGELDRAKDHSEAAKTLIALDDFTMAKTALRRYMSFWKHKEPYQVAPVVLFTDHELWPILSDRRFTESLLTIPHNNEA